MQRAQLPISWFAVFGFAFFAACAAQLEVPSDGAGGGGNSGATGGGGAASVSVTTTSTGSGPCVSAQDCADFADSCNDGTCINGACQKVAVNEGAGCDDGKQCTSNDSCQLGVCTGPQNPCPASDPCHVGTCDLVSDTCVEMPGNDGAGCVDDDACTLNSTCSGGVCAFGSPLDCSFLDGTCSVGACDPMLGCYATPQNDGTACNDSLFCTVTDVCLGGACVGSGDPCNGGMTCLVGNCSENFDTCNSVPAPNGSACDDLSSCTVNELCTNGVCGSGMAANPGGVCNDQDACTNGELCSAGACTGGVAVVACVAGDGCCPVGCAPAQDIDCGCFDDWLVGTPCNGIDYGNGCVPADTGYHFVGMYDGYACFWHQKNQAWNTTTASNFYHLGQSFNVTPGVGKCGWCANKYSVPTPLTYDSCVQYFDQSNVGAWGWCAESDPDSVGFVCIPPENNVACP